MVSLKNFAEKMNKKASQFDTRVNSIATEVALVVVNSLVYDTPVDVSTALSGWQIGLGEPVPAQRPAFFPGEFGSTAGQSAEATVSSARVELNKKISGQTIYISNLEPYIKELNRGSSRQHPGAFVETAVIRGRNYLARSV